MKKIIVIPFLLLSILSWAQTDSTVAPPYKRLPYLPAFRLLETDSSSYFSKNDLPKNKPVLIILFDPSCDHCKHETEEILKNIDQFKSIQIVMATNADFAKMRSFYKNYGLSQYNNIHVGSDYQFILAPFFMIRNLPYLAMYDKKWKLITTFEGTMKIEKLLKTFE